MHLPDIPSIKIEIDGKKRELDLDEPKLANWIKDNAFSSNNYPYEKKLKIKDYEQQLDALQAELVKVQYWLTNSAKRIICVFEGRDAAGKGGTIGAIRENMNPRVVRQVALAKPSDREQGQWYMQRYITHFPTLGEMVLFDRSWYNRAGVEPVMGFCTEEEHRKFLQFVPIYESMLVATDTIFFKFWLDVGREMQLKRFHDRRHDPRKTWKLSPMDVEAINKWDDYTRARDEMLEFSHTDIAPWNIALSNDKKRARLNVIRHLLHHLDYDGKDEKCIGDVDENILGTGPDFLK